MIRSSMVVAAVALDAASAALAQPPASAPLEPGPSETSVDSDEAAVQGVVNRFLIAIGSYDLEALPAMFTANANIGAVAPRDGRWRATTYTFEDFYAMVRLGPILRGTRSPSPGSPFTSNPRVSPSSGRTRRSCGTVAPGRTTSTTSR